MGRFRSWWQKIQQSWLTVTVIIVMLIALAAFVLAVHYVVGWDWTGFNGGYSKITITSPMNGTTIAKEQPQTKTLWDWMQLLVIPVVLAIFVF